MDATTVRKIDRLLDLMVNHAMVVVSGEKIAHELHVTRSSVWYWVEKLRALGCDIEGVQTTGYRLKKLPDLLAPQLVQQELGSSSFGEKIHHFLEIGSTNEEAMRQALAGSPEGTLILAEEQKSGRGRLGRSWYSAPLKGIYGSLILRPGLPPAKAPLLTLAAALAVRDAVTHASDLPVDIRWPNDLMIRGKKFGGILAEMNAEVGRIQFVVLGLGINVNHSSFPKEIAALATSLKIETGRSWSRIELIGRVLRGLETLYRDLEKRGGTALIERWTKSSSYAHGKKVRIVNDGASMEAETLGLDENGFLKVRRQDGQVETVYSGTVQDVE